jgi:ubiquitin-conjugating enzyme E2 D/E
MLVSDDWDVVDAQVGSEDRPSPRRVPLPPPPLEQRRIQQVDVIVLDVSSSMKSRSHIDTDQSREDVSKVMFHTFVDKMMCLEMDHAVGLISFGSTIALPQQITTSYERFHDELGRLDANQSRTRLFDAIKFAAEVLLLYRSTNANTIAADAPLRIFALTDGDDNASTVLPAHLAEFLQQERIVLDAFPLACTNRTLRALCLAASGLVVDVTSVQQGVAAFEDEALLHCPSRGDRARPPLVTTSDDLYALIYSVEPVAPAVEATAMTKWCRGAITTPVVDAGSAAAALSRLAMRRLEKEYREINTAENMSAHVCAGDGCMWKVVIAGPPGTVYEGGHFALFCEFTEDFPFRAPRVRFMTPVYHPNISASGSICLDTLQNNWSPSLSLVALFRGVLALLGSPNLDDPIDSVKAQLLRDDYDAYVSNARALVMRHAMPIEHVFTTAGIARGLPPSSGAGGNPLSA